MRPSPGLILAVLVAFLATQVVRFVPSFRGPYLWNLLLSAAGLVGGELLAHAGYLGGPPLGILHPLPDAMAILAAQGVGALIARTPAPYPE